jgi:hypothetical protein
MHGATSHACIGGASNGIVRTNAIFQKLKTLDSKSNSKNKAMATNRGAIIVYRAYHPEGWHR